MSERYKVLNNKIEYFLLPARFHRKRIPIPRVSLVNNIIKKISNNKVPKKILKWIKDKILEEKKILIFIPKVDIGIKVSDMLKLMAIECEFVHANSINKECIVEKFREGNIKTLLTTTI